MPNFIDQHNGALVLKQVLGGNGMLIVCRKRSIQVLFLIILGGLIGGCQTIPPYTGFEDEEELLAQVESTEMLHRWTRFEIKGGGSIPFESEILPGPAFGFKGTIEVYKNLYFGLGYDYSVHKIDETLEDFAGQPNAPALAENAAAIQWLDSFDRHNILFLFDYFVPLGDGWGLYTPVVRMGAGVGVVLIDGEAVSTGTLAQDIDSRLYTDLLIRPSIGIELPVHENIEFFLETNLDLSLGLLNNQLTVDGQLAGRRTTIDDSVNFSAVSIMGGITFTW